MKIRPNTLLTSIALLLVLALPVFAAGVPTTLSYQGSLTDRAGTGISGSRTLVFSLYGVATGGSASWTEQQTLTVTAGRFSAILGSTSPLDVGVLGGDTWLGIAVLGEPEMTPRQKLTSVAYAMRAKEADYTTSPTNLIPPGTVVAYAGTVAPTGWLMCDGSEVSRTQYSLLFSMVGTAHGYGNGTDTFNIPDYRGRFLRGVDGTAGLDPDKAGRTWMKTGGNAGNNVGSVQGDEFKTHYHSYLNSDNPGFGDASGQGGHDTHYGATTGNTGGNETRPKNAYVNWIIKY